MKCMADPTRLRCVWLTTHRGVLDEAVTTLQHALPRDNLMNSVLPFLELPSHAFEGENGEVESDVDDDEEDMED